jgi:NADH-quinone oxidoreductase subunit J
MLMFILVGVIALVSALGVILSRRPVYSALFLLVNFSCLAVFYIMLEAQFLAAVQVIVYAGAIVVLFLFVVMLIGGGELLDLPRGRAAFEERSGWPRLVALGLTAAMAAALIYGIATATLSATQGNAEVFGQGSIQAIGIALFTDYVLPFEMASVLLLVGMIGAVVLAQRTRS